MKYPCKYRAFTLVELVLSLAIATVLLGGMTSALLLATRALPGDTRPVDVLTAQTQVAADICGELSCACNILERAPHAVSFTVPDRNGDGSPECIRYAWSGTPGEPLTRTFNHGTPVTVLADVHEFALAYDVATVDETYPGPPVESAEISLSSRTSSLFTGNCDLKEKTWVGQYFCPSFPAGTLSWKVTRAQVKARSEGAQKGVTAVQLRPATSSKTPDTLVIDQALMYEKALQSNYRWEEFTFSNATGLAPGTALCLVLVCHTSDADLADVQYDRLGSGLVHTTDAANWSYYDSLALLHDIRGKYMSPGATQTATRRYVTTVRIALQAGGDSQARVDSTARPVNAPEALSAVWESEFNTDPTTLDMNGDGLGDWAPATGVFDPATVSGGIWNATSNLVIAPDNDFTQVTTVELRFRCTSVCGSSPGVAFRINADRSNSNYVPLYAGLMLTGEGTQTLMVYCMPDSGTRTSLLTLPGLPADFVDLRLLIDPALDTVNVRVNGGDCGTFTYVLSPESGASRSATLLVSGAAAQFDRVRIRVGGN